MKLHVREISNNDIPFVFHVFEQNRAVLHGNYISLEEWTEYITGNDADPYEAHFIVTADDAPAAWLKLNGLDEPEICISTLVVDDSFKHKGVGRLALQFAKEYARKWAKSAIRIQTTRDNVIATECYLKCGYEIVREMVYKVGDGVEREGYEFMKNILPEALTEETLIEVLTKMFGENIIRADSQAAQLKGGTVGDVRLVEGNAETADGEKIPYKVVLKTQKKWERYGDPGSWRREYNLYKSGFGVLFSGSFRWAECYHAEMNAEESETQLWIEYIDGVSGLDLTAEMYERAAEELGRFQGKLYAEQPAVAKNLSNLSKIEFMKNFYLHYRSWKEVYDYIRADDCEIPRHLCEMLIAIDENSNEVFSRIEKLPVILCHRDFWVTNIFHTSNGIRLIDWDTAGWGYMGEDMASLIADEADVEHMVEYYRRCVPAYYKGFSEYVDLSHIIDKCVYELILVMFGYRMVEWYKFAETPEDKALHLDTMQKVYEMRDINV